MNRLRLYIMTMLVGLLATVATLQAQKVAFVASETIFEKFTDAKNVRGKLSELQASWMRDIQKMEAEVAKMKTDQEKNRLLWSPQEKKEAESQLVDIQGKLAAFRASKFGSGGDYEKQYQELMGPILEKVQKAIGEEAKSGKYDFVFDKSSRGMPMLYANPLNDITAAVLKRLGVQLDASDSVSVSSTSGTKPSISTDMFDPTSLGIGGKESSKAPDSPLTPEEAMKGRVKPEDKATTTPK